MFTLSKNDSNEVWVNEVAKMKTEKKADHEIVKILNRDLESKERAKKVFTQGHEKYYKNKNSENNWNLGLGIVIFIGGLIATYVSLNKAHSGGYYNIYYGAVLVGLVMFVKGLINVESPLSKSYIDNLFLSPEEKEDSGKNSHPENENAPVTIDLPDGRTMKIYSRLDKGYTTGDRVEIDGTIPEYEKVKISFFDKIIIKNGIIIKH